MLRLNAALFGLALLAPRALAGEPHVAIYDDQSVNAIGERELHLVLVDENQKEMLNLRVPLTEERLTAWQAGEAVVYDWTNCRTPEMRAGAGELSQCIRRGFLAVGGEGDQLRPAKLELDRHGSDSLSLTLRERDQKEAAWSYRVSLPKRGAPTPSPTVTEALAPWPDDAYPPRAKVDDERAPVGFLLFGDSGTGGSAQYQVARGIETFCAKASCELVTLLGDNIYQSGVGSPSDRQWQDKFERPYRGLDLVFHPALGNHDHRGNIQAQIDYSARSEKWDMPGRYYDFRHGSAQFFALDTDDFDATQRDWLIEQLAASTARWKIVYGHHPVYSYGLHGSSAQLRRDLLPILERYGVDFYLSGHDHDKQVIERDGFRFVVSGAAAKLRSVGRGQGTQFAQSTYGFAHLWLEEDQATLKMLSSTGTVEFEKTYAKPGDPKKTGH